MARAGDRLYFTIGAGIFTLRPGSQLQTVAVLPGFEKFVSLAADPKSGLIFFCDGKKVFALQPKTGELTRLFGGMTGELRFANDDLYILSQDDRKIHAIGNLAESLSCKIPPGSKPEEPKK